MSAWTLEGIKLPGYEGRVAVVTGAARNIGRAVAEAMREQGAQVALLDMDWEGEDLPDDPGMLALECDVADEAAVDAAISQVEATFGAPSILVNNAGILGPAGVPNTTLDDWQTGLRRELHRGVPVHPPGAAGDAGGPIRAHHQHRIQLREDGQPLGSHGLRRLQGRRAHPGEGGWRPRSPGRASR